MTIFKSAGAAAAAALSCWVLDVSLFM